MIAFLFGGQGGELPRIGADLAAAWEPAARLLAEGSAVAGIDLARLLGQGGPQSYRTEILQPAMVASGLAVAERLREAGVTPGFVAGHSLGELTAWAASGGISHGDAIRTAGIRGRIMARLAAERPGGMLSLECGEETLRAAMAHGRAHGVLELGARNGAEAWTLTGEEAAIRAVAGRFPSRRIPVQGPWHSAVMETGVEELRAALAALAAINLHPLAVALLCNRTGGIVRDGGSVPDLIAEQLARPVQWQATLETLAREGVDRIVAIGSGKFLRAAARNILGPAFPVHTTETMADLDRAIGELTS